MLKSHVALIIGNSSAPPTTLIPLALHLDTRPDPKMKRSQKSKAIEGTIGAWALALSVESRTVERRLTRAGNVVKPHAVFSAQQVLQAFMGELDEAKARTEIQRERTMRIKNDAREGQLVDIGEVEKLVSDTVIIPLRQLLLSAATTLDVRVNPADPAFARGKINEWVDESLKTLEVKLK